MIYRTKTYVAADFDNDFDAIDQLYNWNEMDYYQKLDFTNVHDFYNSRDDSLYCSIKKSLSTRMNECRLFILIVGSKTSSITKGNCFNCRNYNANMFGLGKHGCLNGYGLSHKSYIEFECDLAIKNGLKILVLYNANSINKNLCPEAVKSLGVHAPMKTLGSYNYAIVRDAYLKALSSETAQF